MMKRKLSSGLEFPDIYEKLQFTVFTEKDVEPILPFKAMSEGMRRTVLLLILLEKIVQYKSEAFLVVDDLGEVLTIHAPQKLDGCCSTRAASTAYSLWLQATRSS